MKWKILFAFVILIVGFALGYGVVTFMGKYKTQEKMYLSVKEYSNLEYPEDPSLLSTFYGRYNKRFCEIIHKKGTKFDFIFESDLSHVAKINLTDIDLALFIPAIPKWLDATRSLEIITLSEREWNRQQVRFPKGSKHLSIEGGDNFEDEHLVTVELARNCLNSGLWEIFLFINEEDEKKLLYHGWFNFPLGHYKKVFEETNNLNYWRNFFRLEHWVSPEGKHVDLELLREPLEETETKFITFSDERIIAYGEQKKKLRLMNANPVIFWKDFPKHAKDVQFTTFVPPGLYDAKVKWGNAYTKITDLKKVVTRKIKSEATEKILDEVELQFDEMRFIVSGIDLNSLPQLPAKKYSEGLYMPLGISMPPFSQSYEELKANPPTQSPYFAALLDNDDNWLDHHKIAIDGPVMFRDLSDPTLVHLYFLSYERIALVAHYAFHLIDQKVFDRVTTLEIEE